MNLTRIPIIPVNVSRELYIYYRRIYHYDILIIVKKIKKKKIREYKYLNYSLLIDPLLSWLIYLSLSSKQFESYKHIHIYN